MKYMPFSILVLLVFSTNAYASQDFRILIDYLKQRESAITTIEYSMDRSRKRTSAGTEFLLKRLGADKVQRSDEPDATELRKFTEIRHNERYFFRDTAIDDKTGNSLGEKLYRWNGNIASVYFPQQSEGRVAKSNDDHAIYDDTLWSYFFELEHRPLSQWLESGEWELSTKGGSCQQF